jgi:aminomethyltransferase
MTNSWRFSTLGDRHRALGSNLEDWSGMGTAWSYSKGDPDAEYMAIRTKAGLMDVSGLKKVYITGHRRQPCDRARHDARTWKS